MGWLDSIIPAAGGVLGGILGGPAGAAIGGGLGQAIGGGLAANDAQNAMNNLNQQQAAANAANEKRYQQILAADYGLQDRNNIRLKGLNNQNISDINQVFGDLSNNAAANLSMRGLGNTTVVPTVQAGIARQQQEALNREWNNKLLRAINLDQQNTANITGVMERRSDLGPSPAALLALANASGQAQSSIGQGLGSVLTQAQNLGWFGKGVLGG